MRNLSLVFLTCTLAVPAIAQSSNHVTLPAGLLSTTGNAIFYLNTNRRFQGGDATHLGSPKVWKSYALRRYGSHSITTSGGTVDAVLKVGLCNMNNISGIQDENFVGTPTAVFSKTSYAFPNWATTGTAPYPFDFVLPFSASHLYTAKSAFLWDLTLTNGTSTANQCDRNFLFYSSGTGTSIGSGCGSFTHTVALQNSGPGAKRFGMRGVVAVKGAPANAPVLLSADLTQSNLTVGGWCSKVYALPTWLIPVATSDTAGAIYGRYLTFPYLAIGQSASIYTQAVSVDSSGGIVLSDGVSTTMPTSPGTTAHDAFYVWSNTTTTPTPRGLVFYGGSFVVEMK